MENLLVRVAQFINQLVRTESLKQGHVLTGALQQSLDADIRQQGGAHIVEGYAAAYAEYLEEGVPAEKASMKQFPFLVKYFQQRGLEEEDAKRAAAATIHVWMEEGMSTQASKRFSETGARQNMIASVFTGYEDQIDDVMLSGIDELVEEEFQEQNQEEFI